MRGSSVAMVRRTVAGAVVAVVAGVALAVGAEGDSTAEPNEKTGRVEVRVVVSDDDRALAGAAVEFEDRDARSRAWSRITDRDGRARLDLPCDATYTLRVSFPGFATFVMDSLSVCAAEPTAYDVALLAETCEVVVLDCPGPVIRLDTTHASTVFRSNFLADLPGAGGEGWNRRTCRSKRKAKKRRSPPK